MGMKTTVLLVIDSEPFTFCYIRVKSPAEHFMVGDALGWKGNTVWWTSRVFDNIIEIERFGKSFVDYNTSNSFMVSEWREL